MDMAGVRIAVAAIAAFACSACGGGLRTAPRGAAPENAQRYIVEYPPPPSEEEMVDDNTDDRCVWVDGKWQWIGRRWEWQAGGWQIPPKGCFYSTVSLYWMESLQGGALYYSEPGWYPESSEGLSQEQLDKACEKPTPCGSAAGPYHAPGTRARPRTAPSQ